MKIPAGALFRQSDAWAVFVASSGRAALRPVQIGRRNDLEAEVLSGLRENENVITHPSDKLHAGVRIQLLKK